MPTLIVGFSTRAIAESAVQRGYPVITLDYFGDRDQRALVQNYSLLRDFDLPYSAQALLEASRALEFEAVAYIANLENYPDVVASLAQGRRLLGNTPDTLRQVRDWHTLREFCRAAEIPLPTTLLPGEESRADPALRWLCKPAQGGGGHGIRFWNGEPLDARYVLQAYVPGQPASAAFLADGRHSIVIGLTEQLIGREELGCQGFAWCGNIWPLMLPQGGRRALWQEIERMVARLTRRFNLRGANGIDLVMGKDLDGRLRPFLIEVNPRYTASMELFERALDLNIFSLHIEAMNGHLPDGHLPDGHLPNRPFPHMQFPNTCLGKGIVYTKSGATMPDTAEWVVKGRRDVPFTGEHIPAGHPVCTLLAEGKNRQACWQHLLTGVRAIRQEIGETTI